MKVKGLVFLVAVIPVFTAMIMNISCGSDGGEEPLCIDSDSDGYFVPSDALKARTGFSGAGGDESLTGSLCGATLDCNDEDPNNWTSCETCVDSDGDSCFVECDAYATIEGPDCNDANSAVYPSADEFCDGIDNQCPEDQGFGQVDEGVCWIELGEGSASGGGISGNTGESMHPSMAVDSQGNPVVAWHDNSSGNDEIYVKRWNGTEWEEIGTGSASGGGISTNSGDSRLPSLALDSMDRPVVAWSDDYSEPGNVSQGDYSPGEGGVLWESWPPLKIETIYIKRWNGSEWEEIGDGSASGKGMFSFKHPGPSGDLLVSLDLDSSDNPVVSWINSGDIFIKRWDGSAWVEIGEGSASGRGISQSDSDRSACFHKLILNSLDRPLVAWVSGEFLGYYGLLSISNFQGYIYLKKWDGNAWKEIEEGSASGDGITDRPLYFWELSFTVDSYDRPLVAYINSYRKYDEIRVLRWDGNDWAEISEGSTSGNKMSYDDYSLMMTSLAVDSKDRPVVAWEADFIDSNYNEEIYIMRWNGTSWEEIGQGSGSGSGISDNSGQSRLVSLDLDPAGNPVVAWMDDTAGNYEIYIKRWAPYRQYP